MISRTDAIEFVKQVHETLSDQTDLSPNNPIVTDCARRFIEFLSATYREDWASRLPDAPELAKVTGRLPLLCGQAECQMEKWWCRRLIDYRDISFDGLAQFWYFENYRSLVTAELALLGSAIASRAMFLGSGALPLTAVLLARFLPGLRVQCVDNDPEAYELFPHSRTQIGDGEPHHDHSRACGGRGVPIQRRRYLCKLARGPGAL